MYAAPIIGSAGLGDGIPSEARVGQGALALELSKKM
jgi:hypothetical protein